MSESAAQKDEHAVSRAFIERATEFLLGDYLPKIERCLEKLTDEQILERARRYYRTAA